ncbi:hypothetical protein ACTFIR_002347 [Dictyostelium discoideum]
MKINKNYFLLLLILLNISNFVLGGSIKLSLRSKGSFEIKTSWITIGDRTYIFNGRGINAFAFDPSNPSVVKMLKSDTYMVDLPGVNDTSLGFLSFVGEIKSRKNWVIAIVSLDDSYLSMSEDVRKWFRGYDISLSYRGSYALVLQSNGLVLNKIAGSSSTIEGSSSFLESVIVSY